MSMTIIEKIFARKAGLDRVSPGETVVVDVDMTVLIDLQFATMWLQPLRIHDPDKLARVLMDVYAAQIAFVELAARAGLKVEGLQVGDDIQARFANAFPDPAARTDMAAWDQFERAHPGVFGSMYRFMLARR